MKLFESLLIKFEKSSEEIDSEFRKIGLFSGSDPSITSSATSRRPTPTSSLTAKPGTSDKTASVASPEISGSRRDHADGSPANSEVAVKGSRLDELISSIVKTEDDIKSLFKKTRPERSPQRSPNSKGKTKLSYKSISNPGRLCPSKLIKTLQVRRPQ